MRKAQKTAHQQARTNQKGQRDGKLGSLLAKATAAT
jgi:hypothetical protein